MKVIRFHAPFFGTDAAGNHCEQFSAGKDYPAENEEARRCIARGLAEEVEVADPEPAADGAADAGGADANDTAAGAGGSDDAAAKATAKKK
jgi:hypothetical protein